MTPVVGVPKTRFFLLTCFTTHAVQVEMVPSIDTSSCIRGIEPFFSRRRTTEIVRSDNSFIFAGASEELQQWNTINIAPKMLIKPSVGSSIHQVRHITVDSERR